MYFYLCSSRLFLIVFSFVSFTYIIFAALIFDEQGFKFSERVIINYSIVRCAIDRFVGDT